MTFRREGRLPNFFVIGVPKGGTTSLHRYLGQHPDVFMPDVKEPAFFSSDAIYRKGLDWYRDTFFHDVRGRTAIGEATPWYFCNAKVARRIRADLPETSWRFIVVLRDPVARAYSMYWNLVRAGVETGSFEHGLEREEPRLADPEVSRTGSLTVGYRLVGDYASHLSVWLDTFGRDRLLVMLLDDLQERPAELMSETFRFLDVSPDLDVDTSETHNPSSTVRYPTLRRAWRAWRAMPTWTRGPLLLLPERTKRRIVQKLSELNRQPWTYPPIDPSTEEALRRSFEPSILRLEELFDLDLSRWKSGRARERRTMGSRGG